MRFAASVTVVSRVVQTTLRWQNSLIAIFFPSRIRARHRRSAPGRLRRVNETAVAKDRFPSSRHEQGAPDFDDPPEAHPLHASPDEEWRLREFPPQAINRSQQTRPAQNPAQ